jgi:hypothetical protein
VQLDIERAASAVEPAKRPRIDTFIATSPIHREHKLRMSKSQILNEAVKAVRLARTFVDDVAFSAEDGSRTELDFLCQISRAAVDAGARTVNIPDTVGYTMPHEFGHMIEAVVKALEGTDAIVSVHCHNDLGLATANSLAGAAGGMYPQWHWRARRERGDGRGRHGPQDAARYLAFRDRHPHAGALSCQPGAFGDHRLRAAAQQDPWSAATPSPTKAACTRTAC